MKQKCFSRLARNITIVYAITLFGFNLHGASVNLAWDSSPAPNITGYTVRYGTTSRSYPNVLGAGTALTATVLNLIAGTKYYFVVTARNSAGVESDPSNEISYTPPGVPLPNVLPTLDSISSRTISEDSSSQIVSLTGITAGLGDLLQVLSVTASSSNPGLIPNPAVSYNNPNTTGTLTLTPVPNASGTATITVTVNDGGLLNNLLSRTFTVTVNPINDPPTLNLINNLALNVNAVSQTVALAGIGTGAANESQGITVTATSSNPGLIPTPTVTYTSPNSTGSLRFTPSANASGTATITVTANDGQTVNNTVSRSFVVTVTGAVNTPPTLSVLNNVVINEDALQQTVNLSGITAGGTENQPLTVTTTSSNPGVIPVPTITYSSPSATGTLRFTPVANSSGTATITVTVNDGQSQNNIISRSFIVTVNPVNDAPTLNGLSNMSLVVSAGQQTVSLSGIGSGATNESQALTVTATSSNPGLIPVPTFAYTSPSSTGTLRFTPVSGVTGTATITVVVNDGQTQNNTITRAFTVSVSPSGVNTPPTLNPLNNLTLFPNSGANTVPLSGITAGANGESQTLRITATSSNPSLIPNPSVAYSSPASTGSLRLTPVAYGTGSATITVTVNDGQGQNNTISRSFTVNIPVPNSLVMYLRADSGTLTAPMALGTLPGGGGQYVFSPSDNQGTLSISINIPVAGSYWVWCQVLSPNNSRDSFFVNADGGTEEIFSTSPNTWSDTWQWTRLNGHLTGGERVFNWASGIHRLVFRGREKNTFIGAIYVTNNRNITPDGSAPQAPLQFTAAYFNDDPIVVAGGEDDN